MMTEIKELAEKISKAIPGVRVEIDPPESPLGIWYADVWFRKQHICIEWRVSLGFDIYVNGDDVAEHYDDIEGALACITRFLYSEL